MRASPYNNPLFADGLASLVNKFIGDPVSTAQAELMAAQALNENLTADYRQGMDVGLSSQGTNLSDMMVRALQAGPEYSGNAPNVSAAINQHNRGILGMPVRGGSGGGASSSAPLTPMETQRLATLLDKNAPVFAADVVAANPNLAGQEEALSAMIYREALKNMARDMDPMAVLADTAARIGEEEYVVDANDSWWPQDWVRGPEMGHRPVISAAAGIGQPKVGDVVDGHRFKGGNPNDPNSWEAIK